MLRAAPLLLAILLCGCLDAGPAAPRGSYPVAAACEGGAGSLFLATISGGGLVPQEHVPRLVEITHEGTIRILQGYTRAGNGSVAEDPAGALHDLPEATAREMLARRNISLEGKDMVVTRGDTASLPVGLYASFCDHVTAALPKLKDSDPNPGRCADEGSQTWDVSTTGGSRRIFVDDCADAPDFRPLQHELETLVGPG